MNSDKNTSGFILPAILVLGLAIMILVLTAMQTIVQSSSSLNDQYYSTLAKEAAESGLAQATGCVTSSSGWASGTLTPANACDPSTVIKNDKIHSQDNWNSTFSVTQTPSGASTLIHATGTLRLYTSNAQTFVVKTYIRDLYTVLSANSGVGNVKAVATKSVTKVASGGAHSCALSSGDIYCWGHNDSGQLGDGTNSNHGDPRRVMTTQMNAASQLDQTLQVTDIEVSADSSCALAEDPTVASTSSVYCWGNSSPNANDEGGDVGDGTTNDTNVPHKVLGLSGKRITKLIAGTNYTSTICALTDETMDNMYCWGGNSHGQAAQGNYNGPITSAQRIKDPNNIFTSSSIVDAAINNYSTCAARASDGHVFCWGWQSPSNASCSTYSIDFFATYYGGSDGSECFGQLSVPTDDAIDPTYFGNKPVTKLAGGGWNTCAITDFSAYCWANNNVGQVGNGSYNNTGIPYKVLTSSDNANSELPSNQKITDIDIDSVSSCAVAGGQLYCWGANDSGQIGDPAYAGSDSPFAKHVTAFSKTTVTSIGMGYRHNCAVAGGSVYCWGYNTDNVLLGDPNAAQSSTPILTVNSSLASKTPATAIAAGASHTCAIIADRVYCWGDNSNGQLGLGDTAQRLIPNQLIALKDLPAKLIAAGTNFTCAVVDNSGKDEVRCWGVGGNGQLGNNKGTDSATPVTVAGLPVGDIVSLTAGDKHACAIVVKDVYCWGDNSKKQLGDGTSTSQRKQAQLVDTTKLPSGLSTSVSAGSVSTCSITNTKLFCWGTNTAGILGVGDVNITATYGPTQVTKGVIGSNSMSNVTVSRTAFPFACASFQTAGKLTCWGEGALRQLGDGVNHLLQLLPPTFTYVITPVNANAGALSGQSINIPSVGDSHACALASNTAIMCWGGGGAGQIGNSQTNVNSDPVVINSFGSLTANGLPRYPTTISSGGSHTCAIADAVIHCWGNNNKGQLGINNTTSSDIPIMITTYASLSTGPGPTGITY